LESTYDADLLLEPIEKETAAILSESIGNKSLHHTKNGFYADILHPSITDPFPPGWKDRLVPLKGFSNVWALDPYDLAMVKLCVGREKDFGIGQSPFKSEETGVCQAAGTICFAAFR